MPDSNWLFRITNPAHRRLCLQGLEILEPTERIERSSVAYHATALPLSYIGWSQRGYSKPRPPRYECGAPPLELLWRGASAENRTPLIGQAIQCPTNRPHPQKPLERTEIIEISSLGWRPRAHPIYHARIEQYSIVKDLEDRPDTLRPSPLPDGS